MAAMESTPQGDMQGMSSHEVRSPLPLRTSTDGVPSLGFGKHRQSHAQPLALKVHIPSGVRGNTPVFLGHTAVSGSYLDYKELVENFTRCGGPSSSKSQARSPMPREDRRRTEREFWIDCMQRSGNDGSHDYLHWRTQHTDVQILTNWTVQACHCKDYAEPEFIEPECVREIGIEQTIQGWEMELHQKEDALEEMEDATDGLTSQDPPLSSSSSPRSITMPFSPSYLQSPPQSMRDGFTELSAPGKIERYRVFRGRRAVQGVRRLEEHRYYSLPYPPPRSPATFLQRLWRPFDEAIYSTIQVFLFLVVIVFLIALFFLVDWLV